MTKKSIYLRNVVAITICLAGLTMFSGCDKDKDPTNPDNPSGGDGTHTTNIVGVWTFEKGTVKELNFQSGVPQYLQDAIRSELVEMYDDDFTGMIWDFRSGGKVILSGADGSDPEEDTYTINGSILTVTDPDGISSTGQYSISGNKLYWDIDVLAITGFDEMIEMLTEVGVTKAIMRLTFNKK